MVVIEGGGDAIERVVEAVVTNTLQTSAAMVFASCRDRRAAVRPKPVYFSFPQEQRTPSPDAGTGRTSADTETILILDFGSQYAQLIARRVREAGAFSL